MALATALGIVLAIRACHSAGACISAHTRFDPPPPRPPSDNVFMNDDTTSLDCATLLPMAACS